MMAPTTTVPATTCQVCGRAIKATSGVIAHHGYQRPYQAGYQTASCLGARFVPYEQSCDRLREVIEIVTDYIKRTERAVADLVANPPQVLVRTEKRGAWSRPESVEYRRPEGFDPASMEYQVRRSHPRTYECAFSQEEADYQRAIRLARLDLKAMARRLAEWVPPRVATAGQSQDTPKERIIPC